MITVAICCHNGQARIGKTLTYLALLDSPRQEWEVLLVDNGSSDGTARAAVETWTGPVPLRVVPEPQVGLVHARMRAYSEAGDILVFVDDDNWLDSKYLAIVEEVFEINPAVAAIGGVGEPVFEAEPPPWFQPFAGRYAVGPQAPERGHPPRGWLYGAGLALRSSAVLDLLAAGFKPVLTGRIGRSLVSGEDIELCVALTKAGWRLHYEPSLRFRHYMPAGRLTWPYLLRLAGGSSSASVQIERLMGVQLAPKWRLLLSAVKNVALSMARLRRLPSKAVGDGRAVDFAVAVGRVRSVLSA